MTSNQLQKHSYFDLWLHTEAALEELLRSPLTERTTLHEWPLSCVQSVRTADGRTFIYKVQAEPTAEPAFYAHARSDLLVKTHILDHGRGPAALLMEAIAGPRLLDLRPSESEAVRIANEVVEQIARIQGDLPAVADLRTEELWCAYATEMLADLRELIEGGTFRQVDQSLLDDLSTYMELPSVLAAIRSGTGYVHHDLCSDNLFVLPEGYRVIDWQRPIWGPIQLGLVTLFQTLGIDPLLHVPCGVVQLQYLLQIAWFVQCARRWFPPGAETYDAEIVRLTGQIERAKR